jgi:hypothetical protein
MHNYALKKPHFAHFLRASWLPSLGPNEELTLAQTLGPRPEALEAAGLRE